MIALLMMLSWDGFQIKRCIYLNMPMTYMEQKFCHCLTDHMLQHYFNDRQELASALNLQLAEMDEMHPSDLAARIFKYCAVNRISLDSVIMQMAK